MLGDRSMWQCLQLTIHRIRLKIMKVAERCTKSWLQSLTWLRFPSLWHSIRNYEKSDRLREFSHHNRDFHCPEKRKLFFAFVNIVKYYSRDSALFNIMIFVLVTKNVSNDDKQLFERTINRRIIFQLMSRAIRGIQHRLYSDSVGMNSKIRFHTSRCFLETQIWVLDLVFFFG